MTTAVTSLSLHDRLAVQDVLARYAWAVDRGDWAMLRSVFTVDAVWSYAPRGVPARGVDAIITTIQQALAPAETTQHLLGGSLISPILPSEVQVHTQLHAQLARRGENYTIAGDYLDTLEHCQEGWLITHREIHVRWIAGNPAVLASEQS